MDYVTQWLSGFQGEPVRQWMEDHLEVPIIATGLYCVLVLWVPDAYMKNREPFNLRRFNQFWNLLLTTFSMLGAYYTLPQLYRSVYADSFSAHNAEGVLETREGNLYNSICNWMDGFFFIEAEGAFLCFFILSKIPEMIDTVFLVLQKKPVIFLHWYHHLTVCIFCWYAGLSFIPSGIWFATMNYCVHSFMYSYYFMCSIGLRKLVRPFAPLITGAQLTQMVVGTAVVTYTYYMEYHSPRGCAVDRRTIRMGVVMYGSYFVLFALLFARLYLSKGRGAKKATRNGTATNGHAAVNGHSSTNGTKAGKKEQ